MRRLLPLLIAAGAALGLPAAASADATITPTASAPFQWSPADAEIQAGQKITWNFSATAVPHNIIVLPQGADFPATAPSTTADFTYVGQDPKTFAKTFSTPGTFRYLCSFHYSGATPMRGTITVKDVTAPPPPPPATGSLPPEPVAVMSDRAGAFTAELFTLTGSESAFKQLSAFGGEGTDPAWNYDAADRKIAWDRLIGPDIHILVTDAEGGEHVDLTPGEHSLNVEPSWSPDSSQIAFSSSRTGGGDIYVMDADGGNVRRLTDDAEADRHPTWAPDGRHIAFAGDRTGISRIWIMDVDPAGTGLGTNLRQMSTELVGAQTEPAWSPVANRLAYVQVRGNPGDPDPVVFDVEADQYLGFVTGAGEPDVAPTWSPDGDQIIWARLEDGHQDLYIHAANDSGAELPITKLDDEISYAAPAWQPAPKPVKPPATGGGDSAGTTPPPSGGGAPAPPPPPPADPGTTIRPSAFLALDAPHRTKVKTFRKLGLPVEARCTNLDAGTVRLTIARKLARKLGLKGTRLASAKTTCGPDKRAAVLLKPSKAVKRTLATARAKRVVRKAKGLKATLTVFFAGADSTLTDKLAITLAR